MPGVDLEEYQRTLLARLSNPRMGDQLERLCQRGSTKIPNYVLPSILAARERGQPYRLLVVAVAGWLRFLRGHDYAGDETPVQGPRMHLIEIAREGGTDPRPLLSQSDVFGALGEDSGFAEEVKSALQALERQGPREVLATYLADDPEQAR